MNTPECFVFCEKVFNTFPLSSLAFPLLTVEDAFELSDTVLDSEAEIDKSKKCFQTKVDEKQLINKI